MSGTLYRRHVPLILRQGTRAQRTAAALRAIDEMDANVRRLRALRNAGVPVQHWVQPGANYPRALGALGRGYRLGRFASRAIPMAVLAEAATRGINYGWKKAGGAAGVKDVFKKFGQAVGYVAKGGLWRHNVENPFYADKHSKWRDKKMKRTHKYASKMKTSHSMADPLSVVPIYNKLGLAR